MSDQASSDSDTEYVPGMVCSDDSDDSCDDDCEYDSDDHDTSDVEPEPVLDHGWRFMADPFSDSRPDALPLFAGTVDDANPAILSTTTVPSFTSPKDAFMHIFDNDVVDAMCTWMNESADQYIAETGKRKINGVVWAPVTRAEMYVFVSLLMSMGIHKLPRIYMYWAQRFAYSGPKCFTSEVMGRSRFLCLLKFLRFSHAANVKKNSPKTRIEPFLDLIRLSCQSLLMPGRDIAVDESLMLWKGRLGFKQFIRTKRSRFGIKVFVLCPSDAKWSRYSWNFEVYYGKDTAYITPEITSSQLSMSESVVVYLMRGLLEAGRHVVTDNWYTSLRLGEYLLTKNTTMTGVVRADRGPPKTLAAEKLQCHQSTFARKGNTLVVKYQDKKEVNVLTTHYTANLVEKTKTYYSGKRTFYYKPLHIERYNALMGRVDKTDQLLEPYSYEKKSLAWFKKLGIHFIFRVLLNSYLAFRNATPSYKRDFMHYILDVCGELAAQHSKGANQIWKRDQELLKSPLRKPPTKKFKKEDLMHCLIPFAQKRKQKPCRVCSREFGLRKDTTYHCPGCPGEPALCCHSHYMSYHGRMEAEAPKITPRKKGGAKGVPKPREPQPGPSGTGTH